MTQKFDFQNVSHLLSQPAICSEALKCALQLYNIKSLKITTMSPKQILELYDSLVKKHYNSPSQMSMRENWVGNELRIFSTQKYPTTGKTSLIQSDQDWLWLSKLFNYKDPEFLHFQALLFSRGRGKAKWHAEETSLLETIIRQAHREGSKNKWNWIAKQLFTRSNQKWFRSPKQCREQWINYLDPNTKKDQWSSQEDLQLIKLVDQVGPRWAKVSKMFNGTRTQNMVKNRYKSLQRQCPSLTLSPSILNKNKKKSHFFSKQPKKIFRLSEKPSEKQSEKWETISSEHSQIDQSSHNISDYKEIGTLSTKHMFDPDQGQGDSLGLKEISFIFSEDECSFFRENAPWL